MFERDFDVTKIITTYEKVYNGSFFNSFTQPFPLASLMKGQTPANLKTLESFILMSCLQHYILSWLSLSRTLKYWHKTITS